MKRKLIKLLKLILICMSMFIVLLINDLHIWPYMRVRLSVNEKIESYSKIEDNSYLSYIGKTKDYFFKFTFKKLGSIWKFSTKSYYSIQSNYDSRVNIQYSSINSNEHIIIFGVVNDNNIKELRLMNNDCDIIVIIPNINGLFVKKITYPTELLEKVFGYDSAETLIYERDFNN